MTGGAVIGRKMWPVVTLAVVITGCGRGLSTVPGRGMVTLNGVPVKGASVAFVRDGERGPAAIAFTDAGGRFELKTGQHEGVVPGKYAVTVQKDTSSSFNIPDPLPEGMTKSGYLRAHNLIPHPLLPDRYARIDETPLRIEVSTDSEKNHFELKLEGAVPVPPTP
jgi:hypothetical protein